METYKKIISGITYIFELTPASSLCEVMRRGLIRTATYVYFCSISRVLI